MNEITTSEWINIVLLFILVLVTAFYAWKTSNMTELMQESNRINLRPYVLIQGAPVAILRREDTREVKKDSIDSLYQPGEYGFAFARDPEGFDYLYYSLKNVGSTPAHIARYDTLLYEVEADKVDRKLIISPTFNKKIKEVIFPANENVRLIPLGKDMAFRSCPAGRFLEIVLEVEYTGAIEMNEDHYYTKITLRSPITVSAEEKQSVEIIAQDEGITKKNLCHQIDN